MKSWVYVLESEAKDIRYVGSTCQSVRERLKRHNRGDVPFTKKYRPWNVVYTESCDSRADAMKRERYFKSGVGREVLKRILKAKTV